MQENVLDVTAQEVNMKEELNASKNRLPSPTPSLLQAPRLVRRQKEMRTWKILLVPSPLMTILATK